MNFCEFLLFFSLRDITVVRLSLLRVEMMRMSFTMRARRVYHHYTDDDDDKNDGTTTTKTIAKDDDVSSFVVVCCFSSSSSSSSSSGGGFGRFRGGESAFGFVV